MVLTALLALVVALCGTTAAGYAVGKVNGNHLVKKHSLSGNRLKPDSVTGAQVAESSLASVPHADDATRAESLPAPAAVTLPDSAGWVPVGAPLELRKDAAGFVHLEGATSLHAGASMLMTVLPAGDRPDRQLFFAVSTGPQGATPGTVSVGTDGAVTMIAGGSPFVSLDSISFYSGG
jgi:hypothetical protein